MTEVPMFELVVRWSPNGTLQAAFPTIDPTITMGMLEMAKILLKQKIDKAADSPLIVPAARIPAV